MLFKTRPVCIRYQELWLGASEILFRKIKSDGLFGNGKKLAKTDRKKGLRHLWHQDKYQTYRSKTKGCSIKALQIFIVGEGGE